VAQISRSFVLDVVVGYAGMMALFLNPNVPPLLGGRCSLLILAMLITMNRFSGRNLGVGKLTTLVRIDYFAIFNALALLLALLSTVAVHMLARYGRVRQACEFDRALRTIFVFGLYPVTVIFFGTWLWQISIVGPAIFLISGLTIFISIVVGNAVRHELDLRRRHREIVERLRGLNPSEPESEGLLHEAFTLFDQDGSGALEADDLVRLVTVMYPNISAFEMGTAIKQLQGTHEAVTFPQFCMAVQQWDDKQFGGRSRLQVTNSLMACSAMSAAISASVASAISGGEQEPLTSTTAPQTAQPSSKEGVISISRM